MTVSDENLTAALTDALGAVLAVRRTGSPQASTAQLEDLRVELADGQVRHLVLKTGGRDTDREARLYRDVLVGAGLDTPGWVTGGAGWLVLERVRGAPLWQSGDVQDWCVVARWLRGAHRRLAGWAEQVDPAVGSRWAEQWDRALLRRPEAAVVATAYQRAVQVIETAPRTLVHGELFPANILLAAEGRPCVLDWETAGAGCALTDLAALTDGWDSAAASLQIASAYGGDLSALPAARLVVAIRWLAEPRPAAAAGGGRARWTDWWAAALAAASEVRAHPTPAPAPPP